MTLHILLESIALILAIIHFGIPLTYHIYLKKWWLNKPWNLKMEKGYSPKMVIIVPTYMGAKCIDYSIIFDCAEKPIPLSIPSYNEDQSIRIKRDS